MKTNDLFNGIAAEQQTVCRNYIPSLSHQYMLRLKAFQSNYYLQHGDTGKCSVLDVLTFVKITVAKHDNKIY